jgi:ABC-type nitrate/sulfonate/bicarbonate transport system substrate-binding protein
MAATASRIQAPARGIPFSIPDADASRHSGAMVRQQSAAAAIAARSRGAETRLVGISRAADFQAIIVGRGSGLRHSRDLRDRRIGLPSVALESGSARVAALRGITAALETQALYHRHVQWVDLPPVEGVMLTLPGAYAAEIAALQERLVDAVYVRGPAGLEAARAAGARVLFDISAHRDPWIRTGTALLNTITVSETLVREHPEVVAQELLQRWPLLPARMTLDEGSVGELEGLKAFMVRWAFVRTDFTMDSWLGGRSRSLVV